MIAYLECEEEAPHLPERAHSVHDWRHGLIGFITEYWRHLETQLTCPAKNIKTDPRPCFKCPDSRVIACIVTNREHKDLIEPHRLSRKRTHE